MTKPVPAWIIDYIKRHKEAEERPVQIPLYDYVQEYPSQAEIKHKEDRDSKYKPIILQL